MRRRLLVAFALVVAAWGPAWADPGSLLLIGGGDHPPAVMKKFIALAGGPRALILIVPSASERPDAASDYVKEFGGLGAGRVRALQIHRHADAMQGEWQRLVPQAGGIFFTGGDQCRLMHVIEGTPFAAAVRAAYARGAVIGGTSAGTAFATSLMITGDSSPKFIRDDPKALGTGLGLFPGVIVDQHFVKRQRFNRLIAVVALHPDHLGVGIDEATAVWRRPDGTLEVLGSGSVAIVDASAAKVTRGRDGTLGIRGMRIHLLLPGDVWQR